MKNELITGCNITTRAKNILISNGIFTRKDLIDELNGRMCRNPFGFSGAGEKIKSEIEELVKPEFMLYRYKVKLQIIAGDGEIERQMINMGWRPPEGYRAKPYFPFNV